MAAIYFGSVCTLFRYNPCLGTGPWVGDDMEQGVFYFSALAHDNASDTGVAYPIVTAMIKVDGHTTWVRKCGNAQSGGINDVVLWRIPDSRVRSVWGGTGYAPTHKEGGLTLAQGGDGSSGADGEFFEGAVVLGLPSDATENSVQANIVSAVTAVGIGNSDPWLDGITTKGLGLHSVARASRMREKSVYWFQIWGMMSVS